MTHTPLHPFCNTCGWRKGGLHSWDGLRCKCGHYAAPMPSLADDDIIRAAQIAEYVAAKAEGRA